MSNISTQGDGRGCEQTNESGNAPMLIVPSVSCWETWRWEVIRASRRGRTRSDTALPLGCCSGEAFDDVGCQQPTTVARICGTGDDDVDARDK
jgi:hypothetical protein